jgi:hypothetical protein
MAAKAFARVPPRVSANLTTSLASLLDEARFAEMVVVGESLGGGVTSSVPDTADPAATWRS